ncbi:MAG TPA: hypothetical protein VFE47_14475 [Tepidisphaeraceae bacterium]|jgi:hypothetical protein|nr:hypothetical protein [Tepidisphaeraceae bacterium]
MSKNAEKLRYWIAAANAMDYFPTTTQADQIKFACYAEYDKRQPPRHERKNNRVDEALHRECLDWAIKTVMEGRLNNRLKWSIVGSAAPDLIAQAESVLAGAFGKNIRITIEEV